MKRHLKAARTNLRRHVGSPGDAGVSVGTSSAPETWTPLVSVVTPSYNQAAYIAQTIQSVVEQSYPHVENIIVDGASTDGSVEIVAEWARRYPQRIRWVSEPDRGQTEAINKGFGMAQGDIVAWLNSDDTYLFRSTLREVVDLFARLPQADVLYGDAVLISADGRLLKVLCTPAFSYDWLLRGCRIVQPAVFFRRRAIEAALPDPAISIVMDYEYWLRLGRTHQFRHVDRLWATDRNQSARKILSREAELAEQRRAIRLRYGQKQDRRFRLGQAMDKVRFGLPTRAKGLTYLPSLYSDRADLAVPLRMEALPRMLWNQLWRKNHELL